MNDPLFAIRRGLALFQQQDPVIGYADGGLVEDQELYGDPGDDALTPEQIGALKQVQDGGVPEDVRPQFSATALELFQGGLSGYRKPTIPPAYMEAMKAMEPDNKWNKIAMMLSMSKAFGSPTSAAGGFGESLANAAGAAAPYAAEIGKSDREAKMLRAKMQIEGLSQGREQALKEAELGIKLATAAGKNSDIGASGGVIYDKRTGKILSQAPKEPTGDAGLINIITSPDPKYTPEMKAQAKRLFDAKVDSLSKANAETWEPVTDETTGQTVLRSSRGNVKALPKQTGPTSALSQADRTALAVEMGVPLADPRLDPWNNVSPAAQDKAKEATRSRSEKAIDEEEAEAKAAAALAEKAKQFKAHNEKVSSGPGYRFVPGMAYSAEAQAMSKITDSIAPGMRPPGSGSSSDTDVQMFKNATLGLTTDRKVNDSIADGYIAAGKNAVDYVDFKRRYLEVNGHLRGADRQWKTYLELNPIFDRDAAAKGQAKLNSKRLGWEAYFRSKHGAGPKVNPADVDLQPK